MQTEDQTPFYIRNGNQTISSTASGYIIIPRLAPGTYNITVGLPKGKYTEFSVWVNVSQADAGYIIKDDPANGWYLVNLESMQPVAIERKGPTTYDPQLQKRNDAFARILAAVVNDSSIIEMSAFQKNGQVAINSQATKAPALPMNNQQGTVNNKKELVENKSKAGISKLAQSIMGDGLLLTYLDDKDTIKVFVPVDKTAALRVDKEEKQALAASNTKADTPGNMLIADTLLRKGELSPDSGSIKREDSLKMEQKAAVQKTGSLYIAMNQSKDPGFTTGVVANNEMSIAFSIEEQKRRFHVLANANVYDAVNDSMLISKSAGSYFSVRFKAILIHQF